MDAGWLAQGGASTIWAGLDGLDWTGIWTGLDWLPDNCEADGGPGCQSADNLDWTGLDWNMDWPQDSGGAGLEVSSCGIPAESGARSRRQESEPIDRRSWPAGIRIE